MWQRKEHPIISNSVMNGQRNSCRWKKKELMNRLPELKEEDGYLKITHFGVPFGIRLDNGRIDRLAEVAGLPLKGKAFEMS